MAQGLKGSGKWCYGRKRVPKFWFLICLSLPSRTISYSCSARTKFGCQRFGTYILVAGIFRIFTSFAGASSVRTELINT